MTITSELIVGTVAPPRRGRFGDTVVVVDQALLLEVLRRRSGTPGLEYHERPVKVTGGFWAEILAVRLDGAPPELDRDLIVRIMPDSAVAERETIVQSEVVAQGFPA